MRPRPEGEAGFTLLEVLVAFVILTLVVTACLQVYSRSAETEVRARWSERSQALLRDRLAAFETIDGTVRGTLALHSIQIGVSGVLDGNVTCDTMNVKGNFSGALDCRDLTIGSRAVVDGKVSFKSITIQRGGVVKGELKKKA